MGTKRIRNLVSLGDHGCILTLDIMILNGFFICRKKDSQVEWLYSWPASSVDREEYLLGKKIDRQVDPTLAEDARQKEVCLTLVAVAMVTLPAKSYSRGSALALIEVMVGKHSNGS